MLGTSPAALDASTLGGFVMLILARRALARLGHPELADTPAGRVGGYQLGAAANNVLTDDSGDRTPGQMLVGVLGRRR